MRIEKSINREIQPVIFSEDGHYYGGSAQCASILFGTFNLNAFEKNYNKERTLVALKDHLIVLSSSFGKNIALGLATITEDDIAYTNINIEQLFDMWKTSLDNSIDTNGDIIQNSDYYQLNKNMKFYMDYEAALATAIEDHYDMLADNKIYVDDDTYKYHVHLFNNMLTFEMLDRFAQSIMQTESGEHNPIPFTFGNLHLDARNFLERQAARQAEELESMDNEDTVIINGQEIEDLPTPPTSGQPVLRVLKP